MAEALFLVTHEEIEDFLFLTMEDEDVNLVERGYAAVLLKLLDGRLHMQDVYEIRMEL